MDWIINILRDNPVIPLFLTIGVGFYIGSLRFKSFSLGPVTATLLVGVLIGQLDIPIPEPLKTVCFMLFLFAIGYSVGPQFFRSLKGEGMKQILFSIVVCIICVIVTVGACYLMGYNTGTAVGMFAGAQTISAVIGVGGDTIRALGLPKEEVSHLLGMIPSAYAVTYVFGTIGTAWIVANLGPVLLGGLNKVKEETRRIEEEMDQGDFVADPGLIVANRPVSFRAFRAETDFFSRPRTVKYIEEHLRNQKLRLFIERLRVRGEIVDPNPDTIVRKGDIIVISGRREVMIEEGGWIGPEVADHDLLNFAAENLSITVSKKGACGMTMGALRNAGFMRGVIIRSITRNDIPLPMRSKTVLERGDVITVVGLPQDVAEAVPEIGYSDRHTLPTDMVFLGLGIAIGCLIGVLSVKVCGIPLSLSASGGTLIAGLFLGWLRNRRPTFGRIPRPVVWFMDNMGLNMFIAVVGLNAGPSFIAGLREVGISLFFVGIAVTFIPLVISIFIGNKIFKFPAAVTLGCVAGSRNAVAALGAIQDTLDSTLPAMGYTVTYAAGNFALIFSGILIALIC